MIKNDRQYQVTKINLSKFHASYEETENNSTIDPLLKKIQLDALLSQIETFKKEIAEYDELKKGAVPYISFNSLSNLPEALIKARIARGWTQSELATRLQMKEQQIQRYELCNYSTASITRIDEIATALDINYLDFRVKIKEPELLLPPEISLEQLNAAQEKISKRKTLFEFQY